MSRLDLNPFFFEGGPTGSLSIHGFSGSPPEMRPMGEYLAQKGLTVRGGGWPDTAPPPKTWPRLTGATGSLRPRRDSASCSGAATGSLSLVSLWVV